jgi:predicted nucleic acid-binding protein
MSVLLDTNVLSELLRIAPDPQVLQWVQAQQPNSLYVSAITQAEMLLGARRLPAGKRRQQLEQALDAMFREDFAGRALAFDSACAEHFAHIVAARRRSGAPISQFDGQIAAIALTHRLGLATRNVADLAGCGVAVTNPWQAR